jgi:oligopeptide/dipeptide ABC transporter ATP-binding protein
MTGNPVILETNGLKRQFETAKPLFGKAKVVRAVDGIDLKIMRGETFAIVGESGCGKSTLARLLVRLIAPSEGSVKYEGRNIADISEHEMRGLRRDLQFIFQDPFSSLNPRMSVGALIEEPLKVHGIGTAEERSAKVAWLLSRVGLSPQIADRYIHEFSGGQRQRIGIARALASGPKVLIGDEPVSALDVSIQAQVVNILEDLKQELGLTLVVIAHDLAVVRHMSDRVAVMYLGEIVELAPVDELFTAPRHPYTAALIAAIPVAQVGARPATAKLEGDPPNPINLPTGCRFHPRCAHATDLCRTTAPKLKPQGNGASVACHHADELDLAGLSALETSRSDAANKRFDLYRAARQRNEEPPLTKTSKT